MRGHIGEKFQPQGGGQGGYQGGGNAGYQQPQSNAVKIDF
jgi:hypothetical protein